MTPYHRKTTPWHRFTNHVMGGLGHMVAAPMLYMTMVHNNLPARIVGGLEHETHQLVHAVEQPIQGIRHETDEVIHGGVKRAARSVASYWVPLGLGGYLVWKAADYVVPGPKRKLMEMVGVETEPHKRRRPNYY